MLAAVLAAEDAAGPFDVLLRIAESLTNEVLLYSLGVSILVGIAIYGLRQHRLGAPLAGAAILVVATAVPIVLKDFSVQQGNESTEDTYANVIKTSPTVFTLPPGIEVPFHLPCPPDFDPIGIDFKTQFPARVSFRKEDNAALVNVYNLHGPKRPPKEGWVAVICAQQLATSE